MNNPQRTHVVADGLAVYEQTIIELPYGSQDLDAQGYRVTTGVDRGLACGVTTTGEILIYMTSNGDDCPLYDNQRDGVSWFGDLGSDHGAPTHADIVRRVREGVETFREAVKRVEQIYPHWDPQYYEVWCDQVAEMSDEEILDELPEELIDYVDQIEAAKAE